MVTCLFCTANNKIWWKITRKFNWKRKCGIQTHDLFMYRLSDLSMTSIMKLLSAYLFPHKQYLSGCWFPMSRRHQKNVVRIYPLYKWICRVPVLICNIITHPDHWYKTFLIKLTGDVDTFALNINIMEYSHTSQRYLHTHTRTQTQRIAHSTHIYRSICMHIKYPMNVIGAHLSPANIGPIGKTMLSEIYATICCHWD